MPWETLGLDEETASERDVKRAYARLLKQHRPDRDPEGFQRIKEAYEQAKLQLRWRDERLFEDDVELQGLPIDLMAAPGGAAVQEAAPEPPGEQDGVPGSATGHIERPPPPAFEEGRSALAGALKSGDEREVREALQKFNKVCVSHPECTGSWGNALAGEFWDHRALLAEFMPVGDLLRELEYEHNTATQLVLSAWQDACRKEGMVELAEALLGARARFKNAAAAEVSARLVDLLAMPSPKHVEGLANHAYENLPADVRNWRMSSVDYSIARGKMFLQYFSPAQREFWSWRLCDPGREWDWNNQESMRMIRHLQSLGNPGWVGYELIEEILPPEIWASVNAGRQRQGVPVPVRRPVATRQPTGGSDTNWGCLVWFVVMALIAAVRNCSTTPSTSAPPPLELPDRYRELESFRVRESIQGTDRERMENILDEIDRLHGRDRRDSNRYPAPGFRPTPGAPFEPSTGPTPLTPRDFGLTPSGGASPPIPRP